jgi:siroheme synthase
MSNPVLQIINDITATGARFVLDADGVGLDRAIPDDMLELARQHKYAIKRELEAQQKAIRAEGIKRLKVAAHGLPLDFAELQAFFDGDIHDFGSGGVSPAGIRKACEWFANVYPMWRAQQ